MFADINNTLLRHLATAPGAAYILRARCPQLLEYAQIFISSRSEVKRLNAAQNVAGAILRKIDFDEMVALRDLVAQQELRRQIKYLRQQDHTAHTAYLYMLGVWLYDNLTRFQSCFAKSSCTKREIIALESSGSWVLADSVDNEFLFQWVYASLLHDVGYVLYDLSAETTTDRQAIDDLFSSESVRLLYGELSERAESALSEACNDWEKRYLPTNRLTSFSASEFKGVLDFLADAPWLVDLIPSAAGKDLFSMLELNESPLLRTYAFDVAQTGYNGNAAHGSLDHAVASGLFLLRYTTFWYWLFNHIEQNSPDVIPELTNNVNYDVQNLEESIIPACRAVAFHNIQPQVQSSREIIPMLTLESQPLTFLAILCDELQMWDRSPAGRTHLNDYRKYADSAFDGESIEISSRGPCSIAKALFTIKAGQSGLDAIEDKRKVLDRRLPAWRDLLDIEIAAE